MTGLANAVVVAVAFCWRLGVAKFSAPDVINDWF